MTTITYNGTETQANETKGFLIKNKNGKWVLDEALKAALSGKKTPVPVVILIPIQ